MSTLLLLLIVPVVWLMLLPARLLRVVRSHPGLSAGVIVVLLLSTWGALQLLPQDQPQMRIDYAAGDAALRLMLD